MYKWHMAFLRVDHDYFNFEIESPLITVLTCRVLSLANNNGVMGCQSFGTTLKHYQTK